MNKYLSLRFHVYVLGGWIHRSAVIYRRVGHRVKRKEAKDVLRSASCLRKREGLANESENLFHSLSRYADTSEPSFTLYEASLSLEA